MPRRKSVDHRQRVSVKACRVGVIHGYFGDKTEYSFITLRKNVAGRYSPIEDDKGAVFKAAIQALSRIPTL